MGMGGMVWKIWWNRGRRMMYFVLGVLAPIILNLLHLVVGVYVVTARGSIMSLGFTGMGFLTKTVALLWLTWLGVSIVELDYRI